MKKLLLVLLLVVLCYGKTQRIQGGDNTVFANDKLTKSQVFIDYEHSEVHDGMHYTFFYYNQDMDDAVTREYILTVQDTTRWTHFVWSVSGALTTLVEFFRSTTHTTDSLKLSYNNDENSSNVALTTIHTSLDDGNDGTLIDGASFGVDAGNGVNRRSGGGGGRGGEEWILKSDTKYLLKVTSGADNNNVSIKFSWYEHNNR